MRGTLIGPFGRHELGSEIVTIGRARANKIMIDTSQASGRHAEVRPEGDSYILVDVGSTNGTKLNGLRIPAQIPQPLRNGDVISIGGADITVELAAEIVSAPTERAAFPPVQGAFPPPPGAFPSADQGIVSSAQGAYDPTQRAGAPPIQGAYPAAQSFVPPPPPPTPDPFSNYGGPPPVGPASYYPDPLPLVPPPPPYTPPPTIYGGAPGFGQTMQAPPPFPAPPGGGSASPYGAPPAPIGFQTGQPGPNRKPFALIAGIIVGVLLIGGVITVLLVIHGKGGPSGGNTSMPTAVPTVNPGQAAAAIAKTFYSDFQQQNYSDAYQYLASTFQARLNEQTFIDILTCTDTQFGTVTSFSAALTSSSNTQAVVTVHVIRPQQTYDDPLPLVMEHGNWRITNFQAGQACEQQG